MIRILFVSCALLLPGAAVAESPAVDHDALRENALSVLEEEFGAFKNATADLNAAAISYCDAFGGREELETAFRETWLAWAPLDSYQFGPIEQSGAALAVNFWPDKKGFVGRGLKSLLSQPEADQSDPAVIALNSVAVQGLPAIELLLYTDRPECPAVVGISGHLESIAADLYADWFSEGGWANFAQSAGPENSVYQNASEVSAAIFTALDFGFFRVAEKRLGRPLGTWERSYPKRAEAWRSGLTHEIIDAQLAGISRMLEQGFEGAVDASTIGEITEDIAMIRKRLADIAAPIHEAVADPAIRIRVEALQTRVREVQAKLSNDVGTPIGIVAGFSPADGD